MQADNFDATLNALRNRKPFRPFTVVLADGDRFEVDHANALLVRDGVAVYLAPGGVPIIFDYEGVKRGAAGIVVKENPALAVPAHVLRPSWFSHQICSFTRGLPSLPGATSATRPLAVM